MFRLKTLQIRISQIYKMGLEDKTNISRRFIKQYILQPSSTGQYEAGDAKRSDPETETEISAEELADIQANLEANGIHWNEKRDPLITVQGTAQVNMFLRYYMLTPCQIFFYCQCFVCKGGFFAAGTLMYTVQPLFLGN